MSDAMSDGLREALQRRSRRYESEYYSQSDLGKLMATEESKIKKRLRNNLKKFAERKKWPLTIDAPPASHMGVQGRADLFVDIGPFHLRIEVKTEKGKMSAHQDRYHQQCYEHNNYMYQIVRGFKEADLFVETLESLLLDYRGHLIATMNEAL